MADLVKKPKKRLSNLPKEYLEKGGPGRTKGVPNKTTQWLKDVLLGPFDEKEFKEWIKKNPNDYYTKIVPKFIPAKIEGDLNLNLSSLSEDELRDRISGMLAKLGIDRTISTPK